MLLTDKFKGLRAVIFDMDGTLVNNIAFHKKAWLLLLRNHQIKIDETSFDAQNHGTGPEMIKRFFGEDTPDDLAITLWNTKENIYRDIYGNHLQPIAGLVDFLELLAHKGINIALATMGTLENIDFILDGLGIKKYFDFITRGDEITRGKPHPEVYLKTIEKLNLNPDECLAIEDSAAGVISAMDANLKCIAITTSSPKNYFDSIGANYVIGDFYDLLGDLH